VTGIIVIKSLGHLDIGHWTITHQLISLQKPVSQEKEEPVDIRMQTGNI
jgi:hypothetical protein